MKYKTRYEKVSKDCRITLDLTPSLYARLKDLQVAEGGKPVAKIVRDALNEYLPKS